jgi:phospholipid/cholesterol/gamma-HCH transport system substrate-binding protein
METRSNWLMVSLVVGLLTAATISFTLWLMEAHDADGPTYEIGFKQSVAGLQEGSAVNLLGVRVGRVTEVRLQPDNPALVIVRFASIQTVPIRVGATASIDRSLLDGSATIRLEGISNSGPLLVASPGQTLAVVPVKSGERIDLDPTTLITRVSSLSDSITKKLDPAGQRNIEQHLSELARRSGGWEGDVERVTGQIPQAKKLALYAREAARAGNDAERLGRALASSPGGVRGTAGRQLKEAKRTARSVERSLVRARPAVRQFERDAGELADTLRSIRAPARGLREAAEKINHGGLRRIELPDYHQPSQ